MSKIELIKADITKLEITAIVNAANSSLMGGGGVDGAIHKAAGPTLHEELMRVKFKLGGECKTGESVITNAGNMPSKYVIHTVGPVWKGGKNDEEKLLTKAYRNTLELAVDFNIKELAFPNISAGIYGYPKQEAAEIAVKTTRDFLKKNPVIERVVFVCFEEDNYDIYDKLLNEE